MNNEFMNRTEGALAIAVDTSALFEQYEPLPVANDPCYGWLEERSPECGNLYMLPL